MSTAQDSPYQCLAQVGEVEFRRLLDKLPAGAYTCDTTGLITYYNPQAVALWGRAPKLNDPVDRYCGSFKLFCARDGSLIRHEHCWMALALRDNREYNAQEIIVERPGGERLTALAFANPIRDEAGQLRGAVNVLVDITDRKRMEDALRAADRSKDEFLATLAHELRNPLAPLRNAVQVLRARQASDQASPADAQWAMDVIERQMHQMARLIDDLLDVSRITRNVLELRKHRVELAHVLNVAVETSRPLLDASGHAFTLTLPPQPLYLDADVTRLAQAVSNLLNNAAKYTERGGRIELAAERQGSDAVIAVRDNGVGIRPEMLGRIFEMFTQVDRSAIRSQGGLGIGLTLVKRLVELHDGTVVARSAGPGRGSEFTIRLPVLLVPALGTSERHDDDDDDDAGSPLPSPTIPANGGAAPLRVIVADDSPDSANTLAMLLRISGHSVRTAYDGAEALDVARQFRPDVILLDIGMPQLSGYDAAREIRQAGDWGRSAVLIALTGWGQDEDRERSREAGFDHHLVKPVDPRTLLAMLAAIRPGATAG